MVMQLKKYLELLHTYPPVKVPSLKDGFFTNVLPAAFLLLLNMLKILDGAHKTAGKGISSLNSLFHPFWVFL